MHALDRRMKPVQMCKNTGNLRAVQTAARAHEAGGIPVRHLGIEVDDVLGISEQVEL
jgi:hypothetical protein